MTFIGHSPPRPVEIPFPVGLVPTAADRPPGYPIELERAYRLRDGRVAFVRPIIPADELMVEREWRQADTATLYQRFFTAYPKLDARRLHGVVHIDYRWRLALVAMAEAGQGIGIANYEGAAGQAQAEVAFVTHPSWRRLGLASALLELLTEAARCQGIQELNALCLQENQAMAGLLGRFGFELLPSAAGIATATKWL